MVHLIRATWFYLTLSLLPLTLCGSWQWSDWIVGGNLKQSSLSTTPDQDAMTWLTMSDVSQMRARDIKRRLSRQHGYGADELSRILDKKELIRTLAFEEYKIQQAYERKLTASLRNRAIIVSLLAIVVIYCWPLLSHLWEVVWVNVVVYYDKKTYEAKRCRELSSALGLIGVMAMLVLDVMQIWLTASVVLSWVMTSKYFFPVPSLSIKPAQIMGGAVASGPLSGYGINVGPMVVTWALRFAQWKVEQWTGQALSSAMQRKKQQARAQENLEEREIRKAERRARRAAREAAEAEQRQQQQYYRYQQQTQQQPQQEHARAPTDVFPTAMHSDFEEWPVEEDQFATDEALPTDERDDYRTEDADPANDGSDTRTPWDDLD